VERPTKTFSSISLIGMPGAGKSTVGVALARLAGLRFVDTDIDIQVRENATLEDILQRDGYLALRRIEEEVLLGLALEGAVVATGGSAVYSPAVIARLKSLGPVVYLHADLATLEKRVAGGPPRGIACAPGQSFAELFAERTPLYRRHADCTTDTSRGTAEEIAARTLEQITRDGWTRPDTSKIVHTE